MQFLNDIIKSRHGFKTAQKFHKFRVFLFCEQVFSLGGVGLGGMTVQVNERGIQNVPICFLTT